MFAVDASGLLVVAAEGLDRDPPSPGEYRFQVVAREVGGHSAASAPLALTVALLDINDNAPVLPSIPPVSVEAGDGKRDVYKVRIFFSFQATNLFPSATLLETTLHFFPSRCLEFWGRLQLEI